MSTLLSCEKKDSTPVVNFAAAKTELNVPYGGDSAQKMDIYLPAGRSEQKTNAIVLIHGGSWNAGNKSDLAGYIDTFRKRMPDYAIFNLNYRLLTRATPFPVQEQDVQAALRFIAEGAGEFGINKDSIVLLGVSAGAHLALLQGYKYTSPVKAKAIIDFFGPTDLERMFTQPWHPMIPYLMQMVTGMDPADNLELLRQSSPVNFINAQSAPTLILQGGRDNIVDPSQSRLLKSKLDSAGVKNELVLYPNEGHGWYGANLVNTFNRIEAFLHTDQ